MVKIFTQYDPPPAEGQSDFGPSLTRQEFLEETDINNILKQYEVHGILPDQKDGAQFADFTDPIFTDYQKAQNIVLDAQYSFEQLPARVRERFGNDPASLIEFVQNPNNLEEANKLGLLRADYKSPSTPPEPKPAEPAKVEATK